MSLYGSNVALGKFPGRSREGVFCFSSNIGNAASTDIWEGADSPEAPSANMV